MNHTEATDLSIKIVDALVIEGLIPDCTNTDDDTEFEFQDVITEVLKSNK